MVLVRMGHDYKPLFYLIDLYRCRDKMFDHNFITLNFVAVIGKIGIDINELTIRCLKNKTTMCWILADLDSTGLGIIVFDVLSVMNTWRSTLTIDG